MNAFFRTAIYAKNITVAEQGLRLMAAVGAAIAAWVFLSAPWMRGLAISSAALLALTGAFGFCPACYLAGRKLSNRSAE